MINIVLNLKHPNRWPWWPFLMNKLFDSMNLFYHCLLPLISWVPCYFRSRPDYFRWICIIGISGSPWCHTFHHRSPPFRSSIDKCEGFLHTPCDPNRSYRKWTRGISRNNFVHSLLRFLDLLFWFRCHGTLVYHRSLRNSLYEEI